MEKSESIAKIAEALCKFQASVKPIVKDSTNPFFKSKYASIANIIEDTRKDLTDNGLSYVQFPTGEYGLDTMLMHTSGEWMKSTYTMKPTDSKPQSIGSCLTYQRRYALAAILGLATEDDDGNEASKAVKEESKPVVKIDPFKGAQDMIDATENADELNALMVKIEKSTKLTDEQKETLGFQANENLESFLAKTK